MSQKLKAGVGIQKLGLILILIGIFVSMNGVAAAPPNPVMIPPAGLIVVDGDRGEWVPATDFFADMHKAAKLDKEILSKLYLRYDCENGILYAMVLVEDGYTINATNDDDQYIKVDGTKLVDANDTNGETQPNFVYIENATGVKIGWEASAELASSTYNDLNVHTQVFDDETSAVANRSIQLTIHCGPEIPEFPTIALPIAAILGLMFILQSRRRKED